jgi:hypothetical protein
MPYSLTPNSFDFTRTVPFAKGLMLEIPKTVRNKITRTHMDVAVAYVRDPMNHDSDPASMLFEEILAVLYVIHNVPEECVHALVDQEALDEWFRYLVRYERLQETAREILPEEYVKVQMTLARMNALHEIVGLNTKYRHSHTLRRDFIKDFKGLFPDTTALIERCEPTKNLPILDMAELDSMTTLDQAAALLFIGKSLGLSSL